MRQVASVLHLDLDAFFAAVEQRDKPSLRGKPAWSAASAGVEWWHTASYEARKYGVRSAMSTREARSRCPHAAFLTGRFDAYRDASAIVMGLLRGGVPAGRAVEPRRSVRRPDAAAEAERPRRVADRGPRSPRELRAQVAEATGGLTASVEIGSSKFIAKVASDLDKPDGLVVVAPGTEQEALRPMNVTVIPGVGPVTAERLRRAGIHTVADQLESGQPRGADPAGRQRPRCRPLRPRARADDDRPVGAGQGTKSVSPEGTYDTDLTDRSLMGAPAHPAGGRGSATRLRKHGELSGRTVTIKVRLHDFTTLNRSTTLPSPTDSRAGIARLARGLLADLDTSGGVRLLGVGVSGLADWIQEDLFGDTDDDEPEVPARWRSGPGARDRPRAGRLAWTSSTTSSAAAGCGARAAEW